MGIKIVIFRNEALSMRKKNLVKHVFIFVLNERMLYH